MIIDKPIPCRRRTPHSVKGEPVITLGRRLFRKRSFDESPYCRYCGEKFESFRQSTLDHKMLLCQGGENRVANLTICCGPCNMSKHGRSLAEWRDLLQRQLINVVRMMAERDE